MPWLAQYGRWDFLRGTVGLIESYKVLIVYLFIYIWSRKSAFVQLINYQLFDLQLSLELKSYMLDSNSHFTSELLIFALGDLTMSNLAYTAPFLEWEHPSLFGQYGNFFYELIFRRGLKVCWC